MRLYFACPGWYSGSMRNDLSPDQWAWPAVWDIPAVPNADAWAAVPDAMPLDWVRAGFVGRQDAYDPFRSLLHKTLAVRNGSLVNTEALGTVPAPGLAWLASEKQPSLPSSLEGLSDHQAHELALLIVLREGADPWGWNGADRFPRPLPSQLPNQPSPAAFFYALVHGFTTLARAMLALPTAPSLDELARYDRLSVQGKGNASDKKRSLLGLFVHADRLDAVRFLMGLGWKEQASALPWRDAFDSVASLAVLEALLSSPHLTARDVVGVCRDKFSVVGMLGQSSPDGERTLRALLESPHAGHDWMLPAILQGMALGGFNHCYCLDNPSSPLHLNSLFASDEVLRSSPPVAAEGYETLGHWLAVAGFWTSIPAARQNFPVSDRQRGTQACAAALGWLETNQWPEDTQWLPAAMEATRQPYGRTPSETVSAARLVFEGERALRVLPGYLSKMALDEVVDKMWESVPPPPYLPPAAQQILQWLALAGRFSVPAALGWVRDPDAVLEGADHWFRCSLLALRQGQKQVSEKSVESFLGLRLEARSEMLLFWSEVLRRSDYSLVPLPANDVATIETLIGAVENELNLDSQTTQYILTRLRECALERALPTSQPSAAPKPRF